jgi:hypothetical protein
MRIALPMILVLLVTPVVALANYAPTTAPSPKEVLKSWTHDAPTWTLEQALATMEFHGDKEAAYAKACAIEEIAENRLQDVVLKKWGKAAEQAMARACITDTAEDDDAATEKIDGDHAVIEFKEETKMDPLPMVKVGGQWKLDVAADVKDLGDQLGSSEKYSMAVATVFDECTRDQAADTYKTADVFTDHLNAELKKLE